MKQKRRLLLPLFLLLCFVYMLLQPERMLAGSKAGLLLWFHTILPTLLPFLILSNLLLRTQLLPRLLDSIERISAGFPAIDPYAVYAFFMGLFCGYPMGAKIAADLYREDRLTKNAASRLLAVANSPSPAFLITYVIHQELGVGAQTGRLLLIFYGSTLASAVLLRICFGDEKHSEKTRASHKKETSPPLPTGVLIDVSIMDSFETITKLGGYIILCSIGSAALSSIPGALWPVRLMLGSALEISTGIHSLAALPFPGKLRIVLALSLAAFGGLCILMQTYSVIRDTDLPISRYLKGKLVQTLVTAAALLFFA